MATKFVDTHPQFTVFSGGSFAPAADGEIEFFTVGNTGDANRKDTYNVPNPSDPPDPSEINPNPVPLDGYGRTTVPVFLVGSYNTVIRDSDGNQLDQVDNVTGSGVEGVESVIVNNVTDLAALDTDQFQAVYVLGTTTAGDGGQGWFYYSSGSAQSDNGVSVIEPDLGSGRWLLQNNGNDSLTVLSASGTADAITISTAPTTSALNAKRVFFVQNTQGANTITTPTFQVNSTTAKTIKRAGSVALAVGDTGTAGYIMALKLLADGSAYILLNPKTPPVDGSTIEVSSAAIRVKAGGITSNELGTNAVTNDKMANNSVDTAKIVNEAITPAKMYKPVAGDTYTIKRFIGSGVTDFITSSTSEPEAGHRFAGGAEVVDRKRVGFNILISGTIRVKFDQTATVDDSTCKVWINGTQDGATLITTAGNTNSRSKDLTVTKGDVVQVVHYAAGFGTSALSDFRITSDTDVVAIG